MTYAYVERYGENELAFPQPCNAKVAKIILVKPKFKLTPILIQTIIYVAADT